MLSGNCRERLDKEKFAGFLFFFARKNLFVRSFNFF